MNNPIAILRDFLRERPPYDYDRPKNLAGAKGLIALSLLLYFAIVLTRSWSNFSQPGLYAEDSAHYFNFYYGNIRTLADIFQNPNGYYNLYNNLVALLIAKVDILLQPFCYQAVCLMLCFATIGAFSFSGLLRSRPLLFIAPFFLGLTGLNHLYYYISLTFQMYMVVVLLLVLLLYQSPDTLLGRICLFFLCVFLIWSGPYSVLIVPFGVVFLVLFRGRELQLAGLVLVTVGYTLSVTESTIMLANILSPDIWMLWIRTLITDIYFLGLKDSVNIEKVVLVFGSLGLLFLVLREDDFFLRMSLVLAVLIISSLAPLFLSNKYLLYRTIYPCHILIGQFLWIIYLLFAADRLLMRLPRWRLATGTILASIIVVLIVYDNYENPDKFRVPVMSTMPRFLQAVKQAEGQDLASRGKQVVVVTKGTSVFKVAAVVGDRHAKAKRTKTRLIE